MEETERLESLAGRLVAAERERRPLLSRGGSEVSTDEEAYRVQELAFDIWGVRSTGYKLGFTSRAMREQMGVLGPNYGRLSARMELPEPLLRLEDLIHPRLEPEVAVLIEDELWGEEIGFPEVISAVRWACPAIEVVDSRYSQYLFTASENTADNSSAARFLLGNWTRMEDLDLRSCEVHFIRSGSVTVSGVGADAMGGPLESVLWLCRSLAKRGMGIEAGSVVLTGGLTQAQMAGDGNTFTAQFSSLGSLSLHCEGTPSEPEVVESEGVPGLGDRQASEPERS